MEARLKELRIKAAKAEELKLEFLQEQIERLERELPELPTFPQLWTGDVTPEHLGTIMSQNNEAMAVLSDEGGIFDILAGLYSDGKANIDLFLQGHAGTAVRVDRGSRPPVFLNRPVLTMGLTIQPQVIQDVCGNKTFRGRGLVARFLFVIPPSNIGFRTLEEPPMSDDVRRQYGGCLKAIFEHPAAAAGPNGSSQQYHKICLEPAAFAKWKEYAKFIETAMGPDIAHLDQISDWAGKLPGAIARIAGLLHIMRYCHDHPWLHPVSLQDMTAAVKIGHVLTNHALIVFDLLNADKGLQLARDILKWITNERVHHFTHRDCLRKFRRVKEAELKPALEILVEHETIREREKLSETHKRRRTFDVNPQVFAK